MVGTDQLATPMPECDSLRHSKEAAALPFHSQRDGHRWTRGPGAIVASPPDGRTEGDVAAMQLVLALATLMLHTHVTGIAVDATPLATPTPSPTIAPAPQPHLADSPQSILFEGLNAERAKAGLPPLAYDSRLEHAGELRVADMVEHGYFDHRSPDGMEFPQAIAAAGVGPYAWAGENLYETNAVATAEEAAARAVWRFMESPPHRAIILDPAFDHVGVGVGQGADSVWVFAVIFLGGER